MPLYYPCDGWLYIEPAPSRNIYDDSEIVPELPDSWPNPDPGEEYYVCDPCLEAAYPFTKTWGGYEHDRTLDPEGTGPSDGYPMGRAHGSCLTITVEPGISFWLCSSYGPILPESATIVRCEVCQRIVREAMHIPPAELYSHGLEACECEDCRPDLYTQKGKEVQAVLPLSYIDSDYAPGVYTVHLRDHGYRPTDQEQSS